MKIFKISSKKFLRCSLDPLCSLLQIVVFWRPIGLLIQFIFKPNSSWSIIWFIQWLGLKVGAKKVRFKCWLGFLIDWDLYLDQFNSFNFQPERSRLMIYQSTYGLNESYFPFFPWFSIDVNWIKINWVYFRSFECYFPFFSWFLDRSWLKLYCSSIKYMFLPIWNTIHCKYMKIYAKIYL